MLTVDQIEAVFRRLDQMDRKELMLHFQDLEPRFPVDFTMEFLQKQSDERLRHLLMALCLQCGCRPEGATRKRAA